MEITNPGNTDENERAMPVTSVERIAALDTLRGFAVLGILAINIVVMAAPLPVLFNPTALGPMEASDFIVWAVSDLVVEGSMRALFSMMFGAGVILITERLTAKFSIKRARGIYYRRTFWLALLGLANAYLLIWFGDILFTYAIAGAILYLFRNLRVKTLVGVSFGLIVLFIFLGVIFAQPDFSKEEIESVIALEAEGAELDEEQQQILARTKSPFFRLQTPNEESLAQEIEQRSGTFMQVFSWNAEKSLLWQVLAIVAAVDALMMMLAGMAFYKSGVLTGVRTRSFYVRMALASYGVGLAINTFEILVRVNGEFSAGSMADAGMTYHIGRLAIASGHIALVMLMCKSDILGALSRGLAATGRMALTNYMMQSVLGVVLFWGLGLFNQLNRVQVIGIMLGIWVFQIGFSVLWLKRFRFGPAEWLWRSLTYWQRQPMRRISPP